MVESFRLIYVYPITIRLPVIFQTVHLNFFFFDAFFITTLKTTINVNDIFISFHFQFSFQFYRETALTIHEIWLTIEQKRYKVSTCFFELTFMN